MFTVGRDKVTFYEGVYYSARILYNNRPFVERLDVNTDCNPPHVYGRSYCLSNAITEAVVAKATKEGTLN